MNFLFLKKFRKLANQNSIRIIFFTNSIDKRINLKFLFVTTKKFASSIFLPKKNYFFKKFKSLKFFISRIQNRIFFIKKKKKIFHNIKLYFRFNFFNFYLFNTYKNIKNIFFFTKIIKNIKPVKNFKILRYLLNFLFIKKTFKKQQQQFYIKNYLLKKKNFFTLYYSLLGKVFYIGKKIKWNTSLLSVFELLSFTLNYSIPFLLSKIFIRLYTSVELKKVLSRKRVTFIPFFITVKRSAFLALKWIFFAALKNINITSLKNKLYVELLQLLTLNTSFALQKLEENNDNSFKNRANIHYRWQKTR